MLISYIYIYINLIYITYICYLYYALYIIYFMHIYISNHIHIDIYMLYSMHRILYITHIRLWAETDSMYTSDPGCVINHGITCCMLLRCHVCYILRAPFV